MRATPSLLVSALFTALPLLAACSDTGDSSPLACLAGEEAFEGRCVDPVKRYEPADPVDHDNVIAFGDPLTQLDLPEPPKRGFRIVAPPRTLAPGEEAEYCLSWPFPASLDSSIVYGARLYTTAGLHHGNVVTKPVDKTLGPQPYPSCHPGAYDPFGDLPGVIPDVLFANSTQIVGEESLPLPPGIGFTVDTSRDIVASIHFLNTTNEPQIVELVYDFFMMPPERMENEAAPFFMNMNEFDIPPHTTETIGATCQAFGGNIVSMMPHTHRLLERFEVDRVREDNSTENLYATGAFSAESDIRVYDPPLVLGETDSVRFGCTFNNTTEKNVKYGLGDNEMCILFGYIWPAEHQFVAFSEYEGEPCRSFQIGVFK